MRLKICKSRVWIYSHIDNENTQRSSKINIKELAPDTSDNFLKRFFRGFNGVKKRGVVQNPPIRFKNSSTTK
ncbi:hypothetical protein ECC12_02865 [Helicobacter pylori]|uniref:Uncharacterized protein n=1 Tax=Helicobacter pylori TaxID=210 RepID=A0A438PW23_HELPX|nr:hypothetical protein ECC12_02865 [Helicobacter pylori]